VNPFHFGTSDERLYGVYHPPQGDRWRGNGVVLCYAARDEYSLSHRAFRQLATQLARAGFPTLRFDYYASGDSHGDDAEAGLKRWCRDVELAIAELRDTAGVGRVSLVGLRLGAALAALAAEARADVDRLVLWDPVVWGGRYLEELRARHEDLLVNVLRREAAADGADGMCGFPLGAGLAAELAELDLTRAGSFHGRRVLLLATQERDEYDALAAGARAAGGDLAREVVPAQPVWEERALWSNQLVPAAALERIVSWLATDG
jgi:dienelactone hydrolase